SFVWLPEGTVKSSRRDEQGNKFGMQKPPKEFETAMRLLLRSGREIVFLPVGISGSDSILGPDSRKPSAKALRRLATPPPLLRPMAKVTVGEPFVLSRETKPKDTDVRDYIMQRIAPLVPEEIRGAYRR
ncbi:MAG: hypothetical protein KGL95_09900, partial [Patescibacteria group bacterium]|nr:hypothetical protein [Patescibacteria group bacterium]